VTTTRTLARRITLAAIALTLAVIALVGAVPAGAAVLAPLDPGPGGSTADLGDPFFFKLDHC
jgi:ABC-type sugar transport system substrate-binding protein